MSEQPPSADTTPFFAELEANFTPTPNQWYDEIMPAIDNLNELKVTEALIRQTYGWQRKQAQISLSCSQIADLAGLKKTNAFKGLTRALQRGFVYRIKLSAQEFAYGVRTSADAPSSNIQSVKLPSKPVPQGNGSSKPVPRGNGTGSQGERLGDESLYMKEREINGDARSQTGQTRKRPSSSPKGGLPRGEIITSMRLPADFSITPEMRAWGERELPPEIAARLDELHVCFVLKYREEYPNERRDGLAAWVARWKSYMKTCASNAKDQAGRRGGAAHGAGGGDDWSPSFDHLVKMGSVVEQPAALPPPPSSRPMPVVTGDDRFKF